MSVYVIQMLVMFIGLKLLCVALTVCGCVGLPFVLVVGKLLWTDEDVFVRPALPRTTCVTDFILL
jgi:hypothetical protein